MIRLTRPELAGAIDELEAVLETGFLVQGENVERFESRVAGYVGRKHGVAVSSGTSAIHCALLALGIGAGDEVIIPDFTFPATANAVVAAGATPVPVDIELATFNVDPGLIESRLSPRTRAIMPVDLFGLPAELGPVEDLCNRHGIHLLEDSACALGSVYRGRKCGSFGQASILSFHPRKIITTGEGGMVLTDDESVAERVRRLRNHGMRRAERGTDFVLAGFNMRMNEIEACLGLVQMKRIDELIKARRRIAEVYDDLLSDLDGLSTPGEPEGRFHTYQAYVVLLDDTTDRRALMDAALQRGVETGIGTYAVHAQSFYRDRLGVEPGSLPLSYRAYNQSLALPIYASMGERAAREVAAVLRECMPAANSRK
jgi:dTDP-4-amino-4,6-dideoxygalactose transaminase